jgi:hypothetical protein
MNGSDGTNGDLGLMAGGTQAPRDVDLDRVWLGVAAEVWRRRPGRLERLALRLLRSPGLARAPVTTPSLLMGWVIASVVVLAAGAAATAGTGTPWVALIAPAVAAAGIAYAYGPGIDRAWELSQSMAVSDRTVLLVRALAVFALNAAFGLAASAASGAAAAGQRAFPCYGCSAGGAQNMATGFGLRLRLRLRLRSDRVHGAVDVVQAVGADGDPDGDLVPGTVIADLELEGVVQAPLRPPVGSPGE